MKENSIEEIIKQLELILKVRKEQKEIIECAGGSCMNCDPDIKALTESIKIVSDYKRALKENEELKEDRKNNNVMISLAQNELLHYMSGYEDGKKHKMTAMAQVIENQQYYIVRKQMEKYEEHIKRLQKENEELKFEERSRIIGKYGDAEIHDVINRTLSNDYISVKKIKDKIENLKKVKERNIKRDFDTVYKDGYFTGGIDALQEMLESEE